MGTRFNASCGHAGWYAVICLHVNWLLWTGLLKGLGVLLPTLQEQFTTDTWMIGGLIATITGAGSFTGPCLMIASILSRATTGRYFTTNYATVNGIATSGHSVGLISFAPLTQVLLDTYGWRGALLLLGAISTHLGVCGLLLRPPPSAGARENYQPIISSEEEPSVYRSQIPKGQRKSRLCLLKDAVKVQGNRFGCKVFSLAAFWIAALVYSGNSFVSGLWLIYFVAYAESKGFSGYEAVTFTTAAGIGNLIFKILVGLVVDRGWLRLQLALLISIMTCGLALFTLPLVNSFWLMIVNAIIFNGFAGAQSSLSDIYTRELLGAEDLVPAFSWVGLLSATIHITFGFFPGWIFDQTGSYDKAFFILGFIALLPLVSLLVEKLLSRQKA
ncbi:monocarboxylate transporter 12-like [Acanthaster planci]|uniref:Monocarboxylate transporter 12-like n=1 Tax=Acanthaster planci TaxID=133434 RepID=A0A8B7ZEN1_ACAPL|nr:monocarboxylate transporter 12-like [Acanthaster planci]